MFYQILLLISLIFIQCSSLFESENSSRIFRFKLIDSQGNQVGTETFEGVREFSHGLIAVKQNGLWGYVDRQGSLKIPFQYTDANSFSGEPPWAAVEFPPVDETNKKNWGYIDLKGQIVVKPQFYFASEFKNGISQVATEKIKFKLSHYYQKYFYTREGKLIYHDGAYATLSDLSSHHFSEGLLPSCKEGLWGFKNKNDEWVISPKYQALGSFQNGLARAYKTELQSSRNCIYNEDTKNSGYWGYIDPKGDTKIPFKFRRAGDFISGFALVNELYEENLPPANSYSYYYIDQSGNNKFKLFFSTAKDFTLDGYADVGIDKNHEIDSLRKTKRHFGNGNFINTSGLPVEIAMSPGSDIFSITPSPKGGIMRITFEELTDPSNDYSTKIYYTKYYKNDLTEVSKSKFPPTFRKYAGPVDEMTGDMDSNVTWQAFEVK